MKKIILSAMVLLISISGFATVTEAKIKEITDKSKNDGGYWAQTVINEILLHRAGQPYETADERLKAESEQGKNTTELRSLLADVFFHESKECTSAINAAHSSGIAEGYAILFKNYAGTSISMFEDVGYVFKLVQSSTRDQLDSKILAAVKACK